MRIKTNQQMQLRHKPGCALTHGAAKPDTIEQSGKLPSVRHWLGLLQKRFHFSSLLVLPVTVLTVAGCVTSGTSESPTAPLANQSTTQILDPMAGYAYNLPCRTCPAPKTISPSEAPPAQAPAIALAKTTPPAASAAKPTIAASPAAPVERPSVKPALAAAPATKPVLVAKAAVPIPPYATAPAPITPPAARNASVTTSAEANTPNIQSGLKLDTEFASAKRIVPFALSRSAAGPIGKLAITELIPLAKQAAKIYVRGRTDSTGDTESNRALAIGRAFTVHEAFVNAGVERQKMQITYCTVCYVASNETVKGRRANRRVDIELLMKPEQISALPKPIYSKMPSPEKPLKLTMAQNLTLAEPQWLAAPE